MPKCILLLIISLEFSSCLSPCCRKVKESTKIYIAIRSNENKNGIYTITESGKILDYWNTTDLIGKDVYPSGMDLSPIDCSLWWTAEEGNLIIQQSLRKEIKNIISLDSIDKSNSHEIEGVIVLPSNNILVIDDYNDSSVLYHLQSDFTVIERVILFENKKTSIQGGCLDLKNEVIWLVDNFTDRHALHKFSLPDLKFNETFSLENNLMPELSSPQDLAIKEDGTFLLSGYGNDDHPEKDLIYHFQIFDDRISQIKKISLDAIDHQKNPAGIVLISCPKGK